MIKLLNNQLIKLADNKQLRNTDTTCLQSTEFGIVNIISTVEGSTNTPPGVSREKKELNTPKQRNEPKIKGSLFIPITTMGVGGKLKQWSTNAIPTTQPNPHRRGSTVVSSTTKLGSASMSKISLVAKSKSTTEESNKQLDATSAAKDDIGSGSGTLGMSQVGSTISTNKELNSKKQSERIDFSLPPVLQATANERPKKDSCQLEPMQQETYDLTVDAW